MVIEQTSLNAYSQIKHSGELGSQELEVLRAIKYNPDTTDQELSYITGIPINALTGRRNGLMNKIVRMDNNRLYQVVSSGKRHCTRTKSNREVMVWDLVEVK